MKITIFGSGYVGLVTGGCLADAGHRVLCVDVDKAKVDALSSGKVAIYEPGLESLIRENLAAGRLQFTADAQQGVNFGELAFIAVGTPSGLDGEADMTFVRAVAEAIGQHMTDYKLVINKSTVPVGTADLVTTIIQRALQERQKHIDFDVCSNPEFLKEGAAIGDFKRAARIIVGTDSDRVEALMRECYAPYNRNRDKMMFMGVRAAELAKYAANAMLATKISFMNEIANIAERLNADVEEVRRGIGSDPRIGYDFIYPGCGYGGSCFPKDVKALNRSAHMAGYHPALLYAVEEVNHRQKQVLYTKLMYALGGPPRDMRIAVWGLAFKPNTDDLREAPSLQLIDQLLAAGAHIQAYDPEAGTACAALYAAASALTICESSHAALQRADALVICTEWPEFRSVDLMVLAQELGRRLVIDGRNVFDPARCAAAGLTYYGIGRAAEVAVVP
ncbi:UDP-glucose dehydrogenase family protein [Pigmentiphaga litoralis]|uniref:UDP-glucose 6-dehydrogenase n=1 Tax=Pigmentiphaga litoralis TaxID=516702 RepID=A0A7Y9LMK3_9BURK|nr:UDP-glucose/GDP-mannose dehydrogenase family protein [Pigmentiphaga litoralis]NYE24188.1 UDPglucose 6-dehydrogenase [Pigmentiphaga litoralis]NYE82198.1 UDPglucose 6-dehydrogenase [Pigmentiphaga litoralis]